jgi:catechol 2,3-dioxygenase-like lactoylglutathione lyase family enzyme
MKFHHIGFAVRSIDDCQRSFIGTFNKLSGKVYDGCQKSTLMIADWNGLVIELIEGEVADKILSQGEEISAYHTCFEVDSLIDSIGCMIINGYYQVSTVSPAVLFDNRLVVFMMDKFGNLIELLERSKGETVKI